MKAEVNVTSVREQRKITLDFTLDEINELGAAARNALAVVSTVAFALEASAYMDSIAEYAAAARAAGIEFPPSGRELVKENAAEALHMATEAILRVSQLIDGPA